VLLVLALVTSCSGGGSEATKDTSGYLPGRAVVVLVAELAPTVTDAELSPLPSSYVGRPGVLSAGGDRRLFKVTFGRQARLTDLALVRAELTTLPFVARVREVYVAPGA
jgi:hypothetical protein